MPIIGGLLTTIHVLLAVSVSAHIILTKDDVRSAIGWIGLGSHTAATAARRR